MRHLKTFESYNSGIINISIGDEIMIFKLKVDDSGRNVKIYLLLDDEIYSELSVDIPDTKKLGKYEFFLNPSIDRKIVKELESQNFISKTGTTGDAAGEKVMSYSVAI